MEDEFLTLTDENGKELKYRILNAFIYNNKYYIIYTDDISDENGKLNAYAAIYDPNDDTVWEELTTDDEWAIVDKILAQMEGK